MKLLRLIFGCTTLFLAFGAGAATRCEAETTEAETTEAETTEAEGGIQFKPRSVVMTVRRAPGPKGLRLPRLNSRMKQLVIEGQPDRVATLKPEPSEWRIALPKQTRFPATVTLHTIDPVLVAKSPVVVAPDETGEIILPAHHAETHGEKLRFEPQPHKNTIGYWTHPSDWAAWRFKVNEAGRYECVVDQGCGKGNGGSLVDVICVPDAAGEERQTARFTVEETGHFQNFVSRPVARFELQPGTYTLEVRAEKLAAKAVCDIRRIRLVKAR